MTIMEMIWYIGCAGLIVILEYINPLSGDSILYGVSVSGAEVSLLEFGRWLLLFFPILLKNGHYLEVALNQRTITLYRYGSWQKWCREKMVKISLSCLTYTVILYCLAGIVMREDRALLVQAGILFFFHCLFLNSVYMVLRIANLKGVIAVIALSFFEGMDVILPQIRNRVPIHPWNWGMANYVTAYGFAIYRVLKIVFIELIIVILIYWYIIRNQTKIEKL